MGRAAAFPDLVQAELDRGYRLAAVLLGSPSEAEDATQEAVLSAWRHFRSLRDQTRFHAWFQRILVNECRDRLRRRRVETIDMTGVADPSQGDPASRFAERDVLEQALGDLSHDHRLVVVLRYLEDLSVDEIAQRIGTPTGTVKSRLHHALRVLRAAHDASMRSPTR